MNNYIFSRITLSVTVFVSVLVSTGVWAQDSEFIPFLTNGKLVSHWIVEKKVAPQYPTKALRRHIEGCVVVGYKIESDGTTSNHRTIVTIGSPNFNKSAIQAAKQFSYKPSEQNPEREVVFTTNLFTFEINRTRKSNKRKAKKLRDVCTSAADKAFESTSSG